MGRKKIQQLHSQGVFTENIILDPGIGFGKSLFQTMSLLCEIGHLKDIGCNVLVGHSRKSFMKTISSKNPSERDWETIGTSLSLLTKNVDFLRVHNVEAHQKALTAFSFIGGVRVL
jgi:dihydropteroate synthase